MAPFTQAMLSFPGTGIQLAVSDTDTAPEGLFFELVKPPHHGIVLKYSADVQELMRAGEWSKSFPQSRRGASLAGLADQEEMDAPADTDTSTGKPYLAVSSWSSWEEKEDWCPP